MQAFTACEEIGVVQAFRPMPLGNSRLCIRATSRGTPSRFASRHWSPTAIGRREPVGDGPLDFACARARRHPRPQALRARRRRFATADRITRWPNRWFADGGGTPGGGRVVSTGAEGRGCHANCPRPATAGSRRPSGSDADDPAGSGRPPNFRMALAFRPAAPGGPEGPHYIRTDFFTGSSGLPDPAGIDQMTKCSGPAVEWLEPSATAHVWLNILSRCGRCRKTSPLPLPIEPGWCFPGVAGALGG